MFQKFVKRAMLLAFIALLVSACGGSQEPAVIVVTATGGADAAAPAAESNERPSAIASQDLNVRTGPSSSYEVAGILSGGATVEVVGKTADSSWLQIVYPSGPGGLGWISAPFVQADDLSGVAVVSAPVAASGDSGSSSGGSSSGGSSSGGSSSGGSSPTATSSGNNGGGNGNSGSSPTDPPPPTSSPPPTEDSGGGGGGGGQTAPDDSNYNLELEFKNALKAKCCPTLQNEISYPNGDSSDKISFELTGFDSVTNSATTSVVITCAGEGAENVKIKYSRNNNTVGCNTTFNSNWTNFNYKGSFEIYLDGGGDAYVTWTAIFNSSK
jgi:hypothetical protein